MNPITEKCLAIDKDTTEKLVEGKLADKPGIGVRAMDYGELESRIAQLEALLLGGQAAAQPFIGRALRPDLSGSAYSDEDDNEADPTAFGSKRLLDRPAE